MVVDNSAQTVIGDTHLGYYTKGVVRLIRSSHKFGPATLPHGTLYFVVRGKVYYELPPSKKKGTVAAGSFLWLPPNTERIFRTDADGAVEYALLLSPTTDPRHMLPYMTLPTLPHVSKAASPSHVETLYNTAEQRWVRATSTDRIEVNGLALLIIAHWLRHRSAATDWAATIQHVLDYIAHNYHRTLHIDELVRLTPWSRRHFFSVFRQVTGETPQAYLQRTRINRAVDLLRSGEFTVKDVAYACGYDDPAYFSRVFARSLGQPPSSFLGS